MEKKVIVVAEEINEIYKPKTDTFITLSDTYNQDGAEVDGSVGSIEPIQRTEKQAQLLLAFIMLKGQNRSEEPFMYKKTDLLKKADVSTIFANPD